MREQAVGEAKLTSSRTKVLYEYPSLKEAKLVPLVKKRVFVSRGEREVG